MACTTFLLGSAAVRKMIDSDAFLENRELKLFKLVVWGVHSRPVKTYSEKEEPFRVGP